MRFSLLLLVILTALAMPLPIIAQPETEKPLNPLSVQVVYADNGHPVRYAQTRLYPMKDTSVSDNHLYAMTDGQGIARFELPPGRYAVAVNAANLLDTLLLDREANQPNYITPKTFPPDTPMAEVLDGKKDAAVTVRVQRGGVITGRVTAADGTPVGEGEVWLYQRTKDGAPKIVATKVNTDEDGIYRLTRLPAGEYFVRAADRDVTADDGNDQTQQYTAGRVVNAFYPTAREFVDARPVKVQTGLETRDIDLQLPAPQLYTLGGLVTLKDAPVLGVQLSLKPVNEAVMEFALRATTDETGRWRFNGLPAGQYEIGFDLSDGTTAMTPDDAKLSVVALSPQTFTLTDQDRRDQVIKLTPGASFSGVVADKTQYVTLRAYKVGLTSAEIAAEPAEPEKKAALLARFSENFDSSKPFTLGNLPAGFYRLLMSDGFYLKAAFQGRTNVTNRIWQLAEGQEVTGLRLVVANDFATLSGRIFADTAQRQPLAETKLIFAPVELENVAYAQERELTSTDKQGDFKVRLPPGTYRVFAYGNGNYRSPDLAAAQAQRDKLPRVTVRPDDKKENLRLTVPLFAVAPPVEEKK